MPAKGHDAYLAALAPDKRATLEKVRTAIRAAAPSAQEGMSYGLPAFIFDKPIAGYSAGAQHCAYYPMSGSIVATLKSELTGYDTSKGAIRFPIGKPLPASLIRKLVHARLKEIAAAKTARKSAVPAKTARKSAVPAKTARRSAGAAKTAGKGAVPAKTAGKGAEPGKTARKGAGSVKTARADAGTRR